MSEEKEFRTLKTDESKFGDKKKETGLGELLEETFGMKVKSLLKKIREKAKDPKYIKTTIIIVIILILSTFVFISTRKKDEGPKPLELSPEEHKQLMIKNQKEELDRLRSEQQSQINEEDLIKQMQEINALRNKNKKPPNQEILDKQQEELNKLRSL